MIRDIYNELIYAIKRIRLDTESNLVIIEPWAEQDCALPELVAHIDLWNQNVEFVEEDEAWARPAVFIEFCEIRWDPYKGPENGMTGKGEIRFHIVTDWKGSAAAGSAYKDETLKDYDIASALSTALMGLTGHQFRNLLPSGTLVNHNHEELLENIEIYQITYDRRYDEYLNR